MPDIVLGARDTVRNVTQTLLLGIYRNSGKRSFRNLSEGLPWWRSG